MHTPIEVDYPALDADRRAGSDSANTVDAPVLGFDYRIAQPARDQFGVDERIPHDAGGEFVSPAEVKARHSHALSVRRRTGHVLNDGP